MEDGKETERHRTDNAGNVKFIYLCNVLESVKKTKGNDKKRRKLLPPALKRRIGKESSYPLLRLIVPELDRERVTYGVKVATLVKLYCECLGFSEKNASAIRIRNWKDPTKQKGAYRTSVAGDFPRLIEEELSSRSGMCSTLHRLMQADGVVGCLIQGWTFVVL